MNPLAAVAISLGFTAAAALTVGFSGVASRVRLPFPRVRFPTTRSIGRVPLPLIVAALGTLALPRAKPVGALLLDRVLLAGAAVAVCWALGKATLRSWFVVAAVAAVAAGVAPVGASFLSILLAAAPLGALAAVRLVAAPASPFPVRSSGARAATVRPNNGRVPHRSVDAAVAVDAALASVLGPVLAWGLLALPTTLPARIPSLIAAIAAAIVLLPALRGLSSRVRRQLVLVAGGLALFSVVVGMGAAAVVATARGHANAAIRLSSSGFGAVDTLDTEGAATTLERANAELRSTHRLIRSPIVRLASLLPIAGPNIRATEEVVRRSASVSGRAAVFARRADINVLRPKDGRVDLDVFRAFAHDIEEVRAPLKRLTSSKAAAIHNPWVVSPVTTRLASFGSRLDRLESQLDAVSHALEHLPALLGGGGDRRYLLVLGSPAEARGSGGVLGNFGEIEAIDGRLKLTRLGRISDLESSGLTRNLRVLRAPADYIARYTQFGAAKTWTNMNLSPDFPSAAEAMANHYPQSGGRRVDGVISVDPVALSAWLELLGPLELDGWPEPLTSANAAQVLMHDSYVALDAERGQERLTLLSDVARSVWAKLVGSFFPKPLALGDALGPTVRGRHMQVWLRAPAEQAYVTSLGLAGAVPNEPGDVFGVMVNNATGSKIDWYLARTVSYDVRFDARSGRVSASADLLLRNAAPASGVPDYVIGNAIPDEEVPAGTNRLYVSVYSTVPVTAFLIDGRSVEPERAVERGLHVTSGWVTIRSGGSATVTVLTNGVPKRRAGGYHLALFTQPGVRPEQINVRVRSARGRLRPGVGLARSPDGHLETSVTTGDAVLRLSATTH